MLLWIKFPGLSIDLSTCVSAAKLKIPDGLNFLKILPIFLLAISSFIAIKNAVYNANDNNGSEKLIAPATPENVLNSFN